MRKIFLLLIITIISLGNGSSITLEYDEVENKCYVDEEEINCNELFQGYDICYGPGCF